MTLTPLKSIVLTAAMWSVGSAALAEGTYRERITFMNGFPEVYGASAPHADPLIFNLIGHDPRLTGLVQIVSTPAPSVFVRVTSDGAGGALSAELVYSFDVVGPSNSYVPIAYTAHFNLNPMNHVAGAVAAFTVESHTADFSQSQGASGIVACGQSCRPSADAGGTGSAQSSMSIHFDAMGTNASDGMAAYGTFSGVLMAPTDAHGLGTGLVTLSAEAGGFATDGINKNTSWAFVDPHFEITPDYLLANPGASIQILTGVGNQSGVMPVPEPGAALLMLAGLAGLAGLTRAKRNNYTATAA